MQLLWPHLEEVFWDAERRRQGTPRLTRREWQVLDLAGRGHSNAEIACMLVTSVSTVRKHLEHIFERTGVHSRGAAVALMMPLPAARPGPIGGAADTGSDLVRSTKG
jgi:DNA-binding CsgD family transcriptional regulator